MVDVLVVDDSSVVRRLVSYALETDPDIRVVATAGNGRIALAKLDQHRPDVVTLDVDMPVMDGLEALREIRRVHPRLPVIMFSTLTERGAQATFDALAAGATDYVTKPSNLGALTESLVSVREQLVPRIKALHSAALARPTQPPATAARPATPVPARVEIVCVGASTGGPEALATVVRSWSPALSVPVVVVQHMPPLFTRLFAERLDRIGGPRVSEAADGEPLRPGHVYLAPGDRHLEVVRNRDATRTRLSDAPPESYCRPAVDVLFRSVAAAYGDATLGVVLTGMGTDGRRGAELVRAAGGGVLVQDAATSVVWGMPGAVAGAGLATAELPIGRIGPAVADAVRRGRRVPVGGR